MSALAWWHLLLASLSAAGVTLLGHWAMAWAADRRDRKRRARRAFAEAVHQCCEELEDAAIHYWASGGGESDAPIFAAKMKAALMKMVRFIGTGAPHVGGKEQTTLRKRWAEVQNTTSGEFEDQDRRPDPEQVALVVGKITAIRAEIAGMRAE